MTGSPWLVVIDPQAIFAAPDSDWGSPMWAEALTGIRALADHFETHHDERVIVTRWIAPGDPAGSWGAYMAAWPFADRPADDPLFTVVPELADVAARAAARGQLLDAATFGKYGPGLEAITGPTPDLVVCGVSTDCCVISTVLPGADAGATIRVVADACAGSTPDNHAAAMQVMGLYPPQVEVVTTGAVLAGGTSA